MPWTSNTHHHLHHAYCLILVVVIVVAFFTSPVKAQQPPPWPDSNQNYNSPLATALIVMIIVFFSVGFMSVYLRHFLACFGFRSYGGGRRGGVAGRMTRDPPRGLDPTIVNAFPTFLYSDVKVHRVGKTTALECAICITEFTDHEMLQLLPKCNHVFHPHCVGPWFASHVTCPVCRADLEIQVYDQTPLTFEQRFHHPSSGDDDEESSSEPPSNTQIITRNDHPAGSRDVIVRVEQPPPVTTAKSPIQDIMKGLSESGRMIRLPRSHSTGHSLIEDSERYTLRLPDEVRNKLVINDCYNNQLSGLPAAIVSPRIGYRVSSVGCGTNNTMQGKPDRWRFSMSPPFISRPGTPKSEYNTNNNNNTNSPSKNNNNNSSNNVSVGILRNPINLFKSMKSPNKSPLQHVGRCSDIGERSSDRLWANPTLQQLEPEGHQKS